VRPGKPDIALQAERHADQQRHLRDRWQVALAQLHAIAPLHTHTHTQSQSTAHRLAHSRIVALYSLGLCLLNRLHSHGQTFTCTILACPPHRALTLSRAHSFTQSLTQIITCSRTHACTGSRRYYWLNTSQVTESLYIWTADAYVGKCSFRAFSSRGSCKRSLARLLTQ
jgi:hypothetical protein